MRKLNRIDISFSGGDRATIYMRVREQSAMVPSSNLSATQAKKTEAIVHCERFPAFENQQIIASGFSISDHFS